MELEEIKRNAEEFAAKLGELNADCKEFDENGEKHLQIYSPEEIDDQAVAYLTQRCPFTLKFIEAPKFMTGVALFVIATKFGLEMKFFKHQTEPNSVLVDLKGEMPEDGMPQLLTAIVGLIATDGYAKTLAIALNDQVLLEGLPLKAISKTIAQIVERADNEAEAAAEAKENQAKGTGITDEAVAKLTQIKTVEDILRL